MKATIKHINSGIDKKNYDLFEKFINFLQKKFPLKNDIEISFMGSRTGEMSTGSRSVEYGLKILSKGRLNRDIMRTLAHEWVHEYQMTVLNREIGQDIGGQNEDEANAESGKLIKMFEKEYPEFDKVIFEGFKEITKKLDLISEQLLITEKEDIHKEFLTEMKKIGIEKLPYSYSSLKQFVDPETMDIHYNKHYKGYVKKLNDLLSDKKGDLELEDIIKNINKYNTKVRNNAGGAFNHALFWKMLSPTKQTLKGDLLDKINKQFGSMQKFKEQFNKVAMDKFGSGWCWLILTKNNRLKIMSTSNQDNPLMNVIEDGGYPLLGLDLWEHAYYLKYRNKRDQYISKFWNCVNWKFVNELYDSFFKMKKTINENNQENIIHKIQSSIEKIGLYKTVKSIGGLDIFKRIVDKYSELKPYLDNLKASCSVSHNDYPDAYFDFYILDVDIMNDDFAELTVDMEVNFSNLSDDEINNLKQWMGAVADDFGFEIYDLEDSIPIHTNLIIKSFNGKPFTWLGYDNIISDDEAFELLDKTGLWEGMIRENESTKKPINENNQENINRKIRSSVEKFGLENALKMFGGNTDIIKRAYEDNPSSFLNQFNNLKPVVKGDRTYYVDEDNKPLFYYYQDKKNGYCYINYYRIWSFFEDIIGYNYYETKKVMKEWLGETYNLGELTPLGKKIIAYN